MKRVLIWVGAIVLLACTGIVWLNVAAMTRNKQRVQRIGAPKPELIEAISEARSRLAEFDEYLSKPKPTDRFALRSTFKSEFGNEYLWVKDPIPSPRGYLGLLDQKPMAYKANKGELVAIKRADIVDWMVRRDGKVIGGFTEKALKAGTVQ